MTDLEELKHLWAEHGAELATLIAEIAATGGPRFARAAKVGVPAVNALPDLIARVERAEKALKLAAVRMDILCDRMEGCHAETGRHALLDEGRAFASEARSALTGDTMTEVEPIDVPAVNALSDLITYPETTPND